MGDDQGRHAQAAQGGQEGCLGVGVQAGGGLVQHQQLGAAEGDAQQGAGDGDPAALAGRDALGLVADWVVEGDRGASGEVQGFAEGPVGGVREAEAQVVGDCPRDEPGVLTHPGDGPRGGRRTGRGGKEAHDGVQQGGLAAAAGAGERDHLAGPNLEGDRQQSRRPGAQVGVAQLADRQDCRLSSCPGSAGSRASLHVEGLSLGGGARREGRPSMESGGRGVAGSGGARSRVRGARSGGPGVDLGEGGVGGGDAVGGVVVVDADLPDREVGLRGEDQDEQGGGQIQVAVEHPEADRHRDHRHRQGRQQLQHQGGEKGDPQRPHGLAAVGRLAAPQPLGLGLGAAEDLQGGQAGDQVGEVPGEPGLHRPAALGEGLGRPADQGHEDRDQRQRERDDQRRGEVGAQDRHPHHQRNGDRQRQLRQVLGEVAVQRVQTLGDQGDQPSRARRRIDGTGESRGHQVLPQLRLHCRRCADPQPFAGPAQHRLDPEDRGQPADRPRQRPQLAAADDVGHRLRDQPGLPQRRDRRQAAHGDRCDQIAPGRAGALQQPRVDRACHQVCLLIARRLPFGDRPPIHAPCRESRRRPGSRRLRFRPTPE